MLSAELEEDDPELLDSVAESMSIASDSTAMLTTVAEARNKPLCTASEKPNQAKIFKSY